MRLQETHAAPGTVEWIGIRPARRKPVEPVESAEADEGIGLRGDHFGGKPGSKRQVTLVQQEHIPAVASILHRDTFDPALLRRNIVVRGINLLSLVGRRFQIGEAVFEGCGSCHPCSRMEENLGAGGWNAMRGHGGITARVVQSGRIRIGDSVADVGRADSADEREAE